MAHYSKMKVSIKSNILHIAIGICLSCITVSAQEVQQYSISSDSLNYTVAHDSIIQTELRSISQKAVDDYRSTPEYNYDEDPEYESSFLSKLWMKFKKWLRKSMGSKGYSLMWKMVWYGIMIVAGFIVLYIVIRNVRGGPIFSKEAPKRVALKADLIDENSSLESIDQLIQEAEFEEDYRQAVRLHYLKVLRLLDNKGQIKWRTGKTNHDYINEIDHKEIKTQFDHIVYLYEYSWYGHFEIASQAHYTSLRTSFTQLYTSL